MKNKNIKISKILIPFILFCSFMPFSMAENINTKTNALSNITADSYYLIDINTNTVLLNKNENKKMYPASITKILTAIIVLENSNLSDIVTADFNSVQALPEGYSSAEVQIGENLTVEQLLELLLIPSCNDVANILANHIGGSIDSFVAMMNTKANDLGLNSSHFTNPYGFQDENHYTTAHDLAILFKYCMENKDFRRITGKASCSIPQTNKSPIRTYETTNKCIVPGHKFYNKYVTCGKTGFTTSAKQCLVSSSFNNDLELICVVLGSENRFIDSNSLYQYAYSNYSMKKIISKNDILSNTLVSEATNETKNLNLIANNDILALVPSNFNKNDVNYKIILNEHISAPIYQNEKIGYAEFSIDDAIYKVDLLASNNVKRKNYSMPIVYTLLLFATLPIIYEIFIVLFKTSPLSLENQKLLDSHKDFPKDSIEK